MSFPAGQLELQLLINPEWEWEVNPSEMKGVCSLLSAFLGFPFKMDIVPKHRRRWTIDIGQLELNNFNCHLLSEGKFFHILTQTFPFVSAKYDLEQSKIKN